MIGNLHSLATTKRKGGRLTPSRVSGFAFGQTSTIRMCSHEFVRFAREKKEKKERRKGNQL